MFKAIPAALVFHFLLPMLVFAQSTGNITGTVINAQNRQPLAGASIKIVQNERGTVTDSSGRFNITALNAGAYSVMATAVGFASDEKFNVPVTSGNDYEIIFELNPVATELEEVVVQGNRRTARATTLATPNSVQRLTSEEIKANPGGNFDISRVVNALPGVTGSTGSVGGFRNDIIIRGGGPGENVFYLDDIEIPVINHFATPGAGGGPTGILNVSFIEEVKLSTSAFDARYDNALSSVFAFKQKRGNLNRVQGNIRLSATELAATFDGPLSKKNGITFLSSVRRSYLQFLFKAIDLPIRPNYWDFQQKVLIPVGKKGQLTLLGVGAIDEFNYGSIRENTADKLYTLNQVPTTSQWNYTAGASYRYSMKKGFALFTLSRNALNSASEKYDSNNNDNAAALRFRSALRETENKFRFLIEQTADNWTLSAGTVIQAVSYSNNSNIRIRAAINQQPEERYVFNSKIDFLKYGFHIQAGRRWFDNRLSFNTGLRTDMNSFTTNGNDALATLSPRVALAYKLSERWTINASAGRYARLVPYTILGFRNNANELVNKDNNYIRSIHYVAGTEFQPKPSLRFTIEGFYKTYSDVPVTIKDGININNLGADFGVLGSEAVVSSGKGEAYGIELFAQQKLTKRAFGLISYTWFVSRYTNANGNYAPSAWDNRNLLSINFGYKFKRNWELGLKYRYAGGVPYTPYDIAASQLNFLTIGQGLLDYNAFNTRRLPALSVSDVRIDKKINFKKLTLDLFLDVSNWWGAPSVAYPQFTLQRSLVNGNYITTNGQPIKEDGSNGIVEILDNNDPVVLPSLGFIIEF